MIYREYIAMIRQLSEGVSRIIDEIKRAAQDVGTLGFVRDGEGMVQKDVTEAFQRIGKFMEVLGGIDVGDLVVPMPKGEDDSDDDELDVLDHLTDASPKPLHPQPYPGSEKRLVETTIRFAKVLSVTWGSDGGGEVMGNFINSITVNRCDPSGENEEPDTLTLKATDPAISTEKNGLNVKCGFADIAVGDVIGYLPMFSDNSDWDGVVLVHFGLDGAVLTGPAPDPYIPPHFWATLTANNGGGEYAYTGPIGATTADEVNSVDDIEVPVVVRMFTNADFGDSKFEYEPGITEVDEGPGIDVNVTTPKKPKVSVELAAVAVRGLKFVGAGDAGKLAVLMDAEEGGKVDADGIGVVVNAAKAIAVDGDGVAVRINDGTDGLRFDGGILKTKPDTARGIGVTADGIKIKLADADPYLGFDVAGNLIHQENLVPIYGVMFRVVAGKLEARYTEDSDRVVWEAWEDQDVGFPCFYFDAPGHQTSFFMWD